MRKMIKSRKKDAIETIDEPHKKKVKRIKKEEEEDEIDVEEDLSRITTTTRRTKHNVVQIGSIEFPENAFFPEFHERSYLANWTLLMSGVCFICNRKIGMDLTKISNHLEAHENDFDVDMTEEVVIKLQLRNIYNQMRIR